MGSVPEKSPSTGGVLRLTGLTLSPSPVAPSHSFPGIFPSHRVTSGRGPQEVASLPPPSFQQWGPRVQWSSSGATIWALGTVLGHYIRLPPYLPQPPLRGSFTVLQASSPRLGGTRALAQSYLCGKARTRTRFCLPWQPVLLPRLPLSFFLGSQA